MLPPPSTSPREAWKLTLLVLATASDTMRALGRSPAHIEHAAAPAAFAVVQKAASRTKNRPLRTANHVNGERRHSQHVH